MQASDKSKQEAYKAQQAQRAVQTADLQRRLMVRSTFALLDGNQESADFWQELLEESISAHGDMR